MGLPGRTITHKTHNAERPTFGHDTTRTHDSSGHLRPRRVWGRSKRAPLAITPAEIRTPRGVASFPGSHDGGSGGRGSSTALKQCHLLLVGRSEFVQHTQRRHLLVVCTVLWRPLVPIVDIDHSLRTDGSSRRRGRHSQARPGFPGCAVGGSSDAMPSGAHDALGVEYGAAHGQQPRREEGRPRGGSKVLRNPCGRICDPTIVLLRHKTHDFG